MNTRKKKKKKRNRTNNYIADIKSKPHRNAVLNHHHRVPLHRARLRQLRTMQSSSPVQWQTLGHDKEEGGLGR